MGARSASLVKRWISGSSTYPRFVQAARRARTGPGATKSRRTRPQIHSLPAVLASFLVGVDRVGFDATKQKKEVARCGDSRPGRSRCSFVSRRGTPARNTLVAKPGVMQVCHAVRIILLAAVPLHVTAPTSARRHREHRFHAGIVQTVTRPSACCRTVWPPGYRGRSASSRRLSRSLNERAVSKRRRTPCVATPLVYPVRCVGYAAACNSSNAACCS